MESKLKDLLGEVGRDHAVAFLRKVFDPRRDLTLVEAVQALSLELVEPHKAAIRISDIVAADAATKERSSAEHHTRIRLADHDKKTIQTSIYELLSSSSKSLTMDAIVVETQRKHSNANRILIAALTRELEKTGRLHGSNGRPKEWTASAKKK